MLQKTFPKSSRSNLTSDEDQLVLSADTIGHLLQASPSYLVICRLQLVGDNQEPHCRRFFDKARAMLETTCMLLDDISGKARR